jgi:Tol biopolymer transport system component
MKALRQHLVLLSYVTGVLLHLFSSYSWGQQTIFGKNKVQYTKFNWFFIQSNHFDVYFTDGGYYLAEFTAEAAESAYISISKSFRYQITNRIPIIVYNSHNDFQQTNVVTSFLEEGIGGVTELFKNRVVIPFEGDYRKFRHVIHHELVHAVINDMFYGGSLQSIIANNITLQLPLWFNEGLAEYEALKWDTDSDMFMRDATVNEYLPPINYLNGYLAYRGGQAVWYYIASKYGEQKIGEILARVRGARSVDTGFRSAIGLSLEELSERWQKEQKTLYWPDIAKREEPSDYATRLTNHTKDGSFYNTSPAISPQGDRIAFISNRDDYFDVFLMNTIDGTIETKLVKGQRTPDFEELHLLTPGITWSPDGKRIALAAKSGSRDAIIVIDVQSGSETKFEFELDGIFSVDWSPVNNTLAFVGNRHHQSDIYIYDLDRKELINLTDDIFGDYDPTWSHDGKKVYFVSDRGDYTDRNSIPANFKMHAYNYYQKDIYVIDANTKTIERVTDLPNSDETSPVRFHDGKYILFVSDLNGINNVYVKNLVDNTVRPITNSLNGVYQLSLSADGNKLAFASLVKGGFDIFLMKMPLERNLKTAELEPTEYIKNMIKKRAVQTGVAMAATTKGRQDTAPTQTINKPVDDSTRRETDGSTSLTKESPKPAVQSDTTTTEQPYGENVKIDLQNFVFGKLDTVVQETTATTKHLVVDNIDEEGNYKVNPYKLNFSPDIIYGNAGYSTFYGVQGSTVMAFSDMLGNHRIILLTNLLVDLKNSDYAAAYYYLPDRFDYGIEAFHSARFLFISDRFQDYLYRFRAYGLSGLASLPLTKFTRMDFSLSWYNLSRENLDLTFEPIQRRTLLVPGLTYVHDNALWGYTSPNNGTRMNLSVSASPKISSDGLTFVTVTGDYRTYYKLWNNYSFALRFAGGSSFGRNPQRFIVGGVDNWINRQFENNVIPIDNVEDFVFLTSGIPLRGYNYNARIGTKYLIMNNEFRFPFFGYFAAGPIPVFFQSLTGILFLDMGGAWTSTSDFRGTVRTTDGVMMKDLLTGMGTGVRVILLGFLARFDVAWSFNLRSFSPPKYYISLGADY